MNVGGTVSVCSGVSNGRIVMWRFLPKAWDAKEAVALYRGPILNALKKHRGVKSSYTILEDNDPAGYKSGKAVSEKKRLRVRATPWPKYSPDLRPLDFSLWGAIVRRMAAKAPAEPEDEGAFKTRLRRVAVRLSPALVRKAVHAIPKRMKSVVAAGGQNIRED